MNRALKDKSVGDQQTPKVDSRQKEQHDLRHKVMRVGQMVRK